MNTKDLTATEAKEVAELQEKIKNQFITAIETPEEWLRQEKEFLIRPTFDTTSQRDYAYQNFKLFESAFRSNGYTCHICNKDGSKGLACWCTLYGEMLNCIDLHNSIKSQIHCTEWAEEAIQDLRVELSDVIDDLNEKGIAGGVYITNLHRVTDTLLAQAELHINSEDEVLQAEGKSDFLEAGKYLKRLAFAIINDRFDRGK